MHLIKLTLLASLASVAFASVDKCVLYPEECPPGTHAEDEPQTCMDEGYPPDFHLICVRGDDTRLGSLKRWWPQGSSRRT
ncbi:hypothetical protein CPB97_008615 [Podila verticillata]|nr:hypothetical protein CPB97_008615 [Podila verticillata]